MKINANTTIFIDRDGVINDESKKHYITAIDEFIFLPTVKEAFAILSKLCPRIIVATNQRVVGKGIITENELHAIHNHMIAELKIANGSITNIFYCTQIEDDAPCRKPNTGMALQAKSKYPEIDFTNSIMIGNTLSDMEFGKRMGMHTIFVKSTKNQPNIPHPLIDKYFNNLLAVALWLQQQ